MLFDIDQAVVAFIKSSSELMLDQDNMHILKLISKFSNMGSTICCHNRQNSFLSQAMLVASPGVVTH